MNVPSGYTALDMVGFTDKGLYNSATAYVKNDIAHYGGNLWRCLVDDTTNVTPTEGANWTVFLAEPTSAAEDIIAPVEASAVSTRQYAVGKQLILNDTLYRVTAAVNIGDTLVVDTNIALSDTVVEQLASKANASSLAAVATSGSYVDLSNQPTLGTAAAKDVPASGNASTTEVVMGDDTRLSDARNAADVYSWAKASTKPTYNGSEINTSAAQTGTAQSAVAATIASGTSMDAAVKDLLDNDVTLSSQISSVNEALSNQLTAETTARQNADSNINEALTNEVTTRVVNGAHNLLEISATNETRNGITLIVNEDKTITLSTGSGGATALTQFRVNETTKFYPYGNFILTGCPVGGSLSTFDLRTSNDNDEHENKVDIGNGVSFSRSAGLEDGLWAIITIRAGQVLTPPITFKPMIRRASDTDTTYQPYAMTNRELTEILSYTPLQILASTYPTILVNDIRLIKNGNVVSAAINGLKQLAVGTSYNLGTLPEEFKPRETVRQLLVTTDLLGSVRFFVDSNGAVSLYCYKSTDAGQFTNLFAQIVWIAK